MGFGVLGWEVKERGDTLGSIEVGKIADLIIIDGSPDVNIEDIRKIEIVFKDGIGYNSQKLFDSVKSQVGAALLIPVLALGVPLFDTIFSPDWENVYKQYQQQQQQRMNIFNTNKKIRK